MKIYVYETEKGLLHSSYKTKLLSILGALPPKQNIEILPFNNNLKQALENSIMLYDFQEYIYSLYDDSSSVRFLICATKNDKYQEWVASEESEAWGRCWDDFIAIEFAPKNNRLAVQLHESLHFFYVDDCYDETNNRKVKKSCRNEECLMHFHPDSCVPCEEVFDQLRNWGSV